MTRDSIVWWLGIAAGIVAFLMGQPPIAEWSYYQWLGAIGVLIATVSGKLASSPLKGADKNSARPTSIGPAVFVMLALALASVGCGATIRDNVRKSASIAGETVLTLDQLEYDLHDAGVISDAKHEALKVPIVDVLTKVRAYVRVAKAWPYNAEPPATLNEARVAALASLAVLESALEGVDGVSAITNALAVIREKIERVTS